MSLLASAASARVIMRSTMAMICSRAEDGPRTSAPFRARGRRSWLAVTVVRPIPAAAHAVAEPHRRGQACLRHVLGSRHVLGNEPSVFVAAAAPGPRYGRRCRRPLRRPIAHPRPDRPGPSGLDMIAGCRPVTCQLAYCACGKVVWAVRTMLSAALASAIW